MPDKKGDSSDLDTKSGGVVKGGNTQETSQSEGSESPGQTERKVGRTPGQAEGSDDTDDQNEK